MLYKFRRFFSINNSYGAIGIGSMIVFIAMVLVAGIAASVLIVTSGQLEAQAMDTGDQTRDEVSSDISVSDITGQFGTRTIDGISYSRFHNMTITVSARSASTIALDKTIIKISNEDNLIILSWDSNKYSSSASASGVFLTNGLFDLSANKFGIIVGNDRDNSCTSSYPAINKGDIVYLTINLSACFNGLAYRTDITGKIIPEQGSPGVFLFRTPASTSRTIVDFL